MEQHSSTSTHQDDKDNEHFDSELIASIIDGSRNELVISILKKASILNATDSSGNTLLHIAAQYDNDVITQHLIRSGCKIDAQNNSGKTPLIVAIENRSENSTGILLEANANTLISDKAEKNALHYFLDANWFNGFYLVWTFLKSLERQCLNNIEIIATKLIDARWPLPCVRFLENIDVTKAMLKRGCEVDARQPGTGRTALHEAVLSSDVALVTLLLDYGADANAIDEFHWAPLQYVYGKERQHADERLEIVKLLITKGALTITTTTDESRWSQMDTVLRYGNREAIQILLDANLDLTIEDANGTTPVHVLAMNTNSDAFKALNNRNFEVDACTFNWETPLWIASAFGNVCAVELLLEKGAKVNFPCDENTSPLRKCVERFLPELEKQYLKCIQLLLEYGAEVYNEFDSDEDPTTLFEIVKEKQIYNVGELLIAHLVLQEVRAMPIEILTLRHIQSHSTFKKYYDFCKRQLAVKMFKSVTLLELLTVSDDKFESYARDQQCASCIDDFDKEWKLKLYYYNTILQRRYFKADRMLKLRKEAAIHVCKIMKTDYFRFPLIAEQIVHFLDEADLRNLLQVSL